MSWDTRVVPEAIIVYYVRCSTCNLDHKCDSERDAEELRRTHWASHDRRYAANEMDLGFDLNPDPETRRPDLRTDAWNDAQRKQEQARGHR